MFRRASALDSSCHGTHSGLSQALGRRAWELTLRPGQPPRETGRALKLSTEATEITPRSPMAWQVLGWAHYRNEDYTAAIAALQKSISLQPDGGDGGQWFFLAMSFQRAGDTDAARRWFDKGDRVLRERPPANKAFQGMRDEAAAVLGLTSRGTT
jgi:tetratricopeptide (TPR) repeat protein